MPKTAIFALGFATAFMIPITRSFLIGMEIGIMRSREELERQKASKSA